jgi:predicted amidophosphoribosyltransferase
MPAKRRQRRGGVPWVICRFDLTPPSGECTRCGERLPIILPIRLSVLAAMGKAFVKEHRHCQPRSEGEASP